MRPRACLLRVQISEAYESQERRFNYTTPKSFLELIALYKGMLGKEREKVDKNIKKLSDGVIKLESTAESVAVCTAVPLRSNFAYPMKSFKPP